MLAFVAVFVLRGIRPDWRQWRTRDGVQSWRLKGLRDVAVWLSLLTVTTVALALPSGGAAGRAKGTILSCAILGGALLIASLQLAAVLSRRSERRFDEAALRERGLPLRKRMASTRLVASLSFIAAPLALIAVSPVLSLPLALIDDAATQRAAAALIGLVLVASWLVGAVWVTLRQWRRERTEERVYWPRYRAARRGLADTREDAR